MSSTNSFVERGREFAAQAIDADNAKLYDEALRLYTLSCDNFATALKYEKNPRIQGIVEGKLKEYLGRAEKLKEYIKKRGPAQVDSPVSSSNISSNGEGPSVGRDDEYTAIARTFIMKEKPKVKFSDIAGLGTAKSKLVDAVLMPRKQPQLYDADSPPSPGILFYGPPGTGKTQLARAVANECGENVTFFNLSASALVCKYLGDGERLMRAVFELARKLAPSILFMDEIDSIMRSRSDGSGGGGGGSGGASESIDRLKTEFLVQTEGMVSNANVLVIGATNLPFAIDQGARRRFVHRVYIPLPDRAARREMFVKQLEKFNLSKDNIDRFVSSTEGYSCADIATLLKTASGYHRQRVVDATHFLTVDSNPPGNGPCYTPCSPGDPRGQEMNWSTIPNGKLAKGTVTMRDVERAVRETKPSVNLADLAKYEEFTRQFGLEG